MTPTHQSEPAECSISHRIKNGVCIVRLTGDFITIYDVDRIQEHIKRLFDRDDYSKCVFNVKEVRHMNSKGLGLLITYYHALRAKQRVLGLSGCSPHVMNLLKLTHLDKVFKLYETEEEALAD